MKSFKTFNEKALIKSDLKPFKLMKNKNGTRVWDSENGLRIKAKRISSNVYYEIHIIKGGKIGDVNKNGEVIKAKELQSALSDLGAKYNFHYIGNKKQAVRNSEVGRRIYNDWDNLQRHFQHEIHGTYKTL